MDKNNLNFLNVRYILENFYGGRIGNDINVPHPLFKKNHFKHTITCCSLNKQGKFYEIIHKAILRQVCVYEYILREDKLQNFKKKPGSYSINTITYYENYVSFLRMCILELGKEIKDYFLHYNVKKSNLNREEVKTFLIRNEIFLQEKEIDDIILNKIYEDDILNLMFYFYQMLLTNNKINQKMIDSVKKPLVEKYIICGDETRNAEFFLILDKHRKKRKKEELKKKVKINPDKKLEIVESNFNDVYTLKSQYNCIKKLQLINSTNNHVTKNHNYVDVSRYIQFNDNGKYGVIKYKLHYCYDCNTYFDFKSSFDEQLRKNSLNINNLKIAVEYHDSSLYGTELYNELGESILHQHGYKVGDHGLQRYKRQTLLKELIDQKIVSIADAKEIINIDIRRFGKRKNFDKALSDWKMDIEYLNTLIK